MEIKEKIIIDLNDLFPPKASLQVVQEKLKNWDVAAYKNKKVQIRGCSPTWAHLLVAGKLFGVVEALDFILDDSKGGIVIPIIPSSLT